MSLSVCLSDRLSPSLTLCVCLSLSVCLSISVSVCLSLSLSLVWFRITSLEGCNLFLHQIQTELPRGALFTFSARVSVGFCVYVRECVSLSVFVCNCYRHFSYAHHLDFHFTPSLWTLKQFRFRFRFRSFIHQVLS